MGAPNKTSYWDYIKVEELLSLQTGIDADESELSNDEVRFIVIHQIDELWLKLILRELTRVRDLFNQARIPETELVAVAASLGRVTTTFGMLADHFRLMETMRTQDYLQFRDKLFPASGFQSAQMRELEVLLGLGESDRIPFGHEGSYLDVLKNDDGSESSAFRRVRRRMEDTPSLKKVIDAWLYRTPIQGSQPGEPGDDTVVDDFIAAFLQGQARQLEQARDHAVQMQAVTAEDRQRLKQSYQKQMDGAGVYLRAENVEDPQQRARVRRLRAAILFIDSNRQLPLLSWPGQIIDALIEAEQGMLVFRQRHARMVERVIGRRVGTGGSDGVDYLDQTALRYRVFKEIWAARTLLLRSDLTPSIDQPDFYGLRAM